MSSSADVEVGTATKKDDDTCATAGEAVDKKAADVLLPIRASRAVVESDKDSNTVLPGVVVDSLVGMLTAAVDTGPALVVSVEVSVPVSVTIGVVIVVSVGVHVFDVVEIS